jgi:IS5 family transposase
MKLHLLVNEKGERLSHAITTGSTDDRKPLPKMLENIAGVVIGDRGYISDDLEFSLAEQGVKLITRTRSNMFERVLTNWEQNKLRKRGFIETINDQLKNTLHIAHTRYRSVEAFFVNVLSGLAAYWFKPKKPCIS